MMMGGREGGREGERSGFHFSLVTSRGAAFWVGSRSLTIHGRGGAVACRIGEPRFAGGADPGSGSLGSPQFVIGCRFLVFLLQFLFARPIFFRFSTSKSSSTPLTWSVTYQKSGQKQSLL
jgi:hypothetical protein